MLKIKWLLIPLVFLITFTLSFYLSENIALIPQFKNNRSLDKKFGIHFTNVIGFLPYWLLDEASTDYSPYLTNLTYFGLAVSGDGSIYKKSASNESEPGYLNFSTTKLNNYLNSARQKSLETSLLLYAATDTSIDELIKNPKDSANKLVSELIPLMKENSYTDLDIDLETLRVATADEQKAFTQFLSILSQNLKAHNFTLTICLPVAAFSYDTIISPIQIQPLVDRVVIMTYDYFYRASSHTGPNAPLDEVESVLNSALKTFKSEQIILGIPLYSYQWETLKNTPSSAIIPSSGQTFTQKELSELLNAGCSLCQYFKDSKSSETALIYPDADTGTYFQTYIHDENAFSQKISLVKKYNLGGAAFWALGYESEKYLSPFSTLKSYSWQTKVF